MFSRPFFPSVRDQRISSTVVGLSSPERLDALLRSLTAHLPDALFDELADWTPSRQQWVDFRPR